MDTWLDIWSGIWAEYWGMEVPSVADTDSRYYNVQVEVYKDNAPHTLVEILHARYEPTVLSEIRGHGAGSFKISKRDAKIIADPLLIDYRNFVRIRLNGRVIGAFVIQTLKTIIVGEGEEADEMWEVSGEGLRSWFRDAAVFPAKGLKTASAETRYFNFASERGSWYNSADWTAAVPSWQKQIGGWWGTAPAEWPDAPLAWWIWDRNPFPASAMPEGFVYFRYEFTTTGTFDYSWFFACDNQAEVYIDGELVMTTEIAGGWEETKRVDQTLEAGDHIIAVKAFNLNSGSPGGLIGALFKVGDPAVPSSAELVNVTGPETWRVNGYPAVEPGWTPGDLLLTLLTEADDRGLRFAQNLTPTFTVDVDSSGQVWGDPVPWSFEVGTTYEDVIDAVEELGCDIYLDPNTLHLFAWKKRGADKSIDSGSENPVFLAPAFNLVSAEETGQAQIANTLMLRTTEGWSLQVPEDTTSLTRYGRIETQLSTKLSTSGATPLVSELFRQKALPEKSATFELIPVPGMIPFDNFNVGDYISAPGQVPGVLEKRRVMSISFAEDSETGRPIYAIEFDTIFKDRQAELEKWISRVANSSAIGGGFTNSSNLPSTVVTPPAGHTLGTVPDAPTGLVVSTVGYYTDSGESSSDFSLVWNPVITGVGYGTVEVTGYEVWGKLATATEFQSMAFVFDSMAYMSGFRPGDEWVFKVRAVSRTGGPGPFSPDVALVADPPLEPLDTPSAPILEANLGTVTIRWDGELEGSPAPGFIRYVRVERAPTLSGPWTTVGLITRESTSDSSVVVGEVYFYRFVAVDGFGNTSAPSGSEFIEVTGVSSGDITGSLPTNNEVFNGSFENQLSGWEILSRYNLSSTATIVTSSISGQNSLRLTRGSETGGSEVDLILAQKTDKFIPVSAAGGTGYYVSARVNAPSSVSGGFSLIVYWYLTDKVTPASLPLEYVFATRDVSTSPTLLVGQVFPPADAKYMRIGLVGAAPSSAINVDDVVVREILSSDMLGEGVLTALHFSAGSVTANALAAESVTTPALAAGSIIGEKVAAGAITTNHLSAEVGASLDISSNESVNIIINRQDGLEEDLASTDEAVTDLTTYYNFGADGAIIGKTDSAIKLYLKNDRIEIVENGIVVSYWDSGRMVVPSFVGEEVILGNHKIEKYAIGTVVKAV